MRSVQGSEPSTILTAVSFHTIWRESKTNWDFFWFKISNTVKHKKINPKTWEASLLQTGNDLLQFLLMVPTITSLKDERLSFLAMNFFRWRTVAWAEQRIHFRFRPRSLLLLHSRQMLTFRRKDTAGRPRQEGRTGRCVGAFLDTCYSTG